MMDHVLWAPLPERHVESIEHQLGGKRRRHRPANDPSTEHIEHDREIDEAYPRRNIRDIGHPQRIRTIIRKRTISKVWSRPCPVSHRRSCDPAPTDASYALSAHEPRHALAAHVNALVCKLSVNAGCSIRPVRSRMDRNDAIPQHGILDRTPRRRSSRPRMIAAGGDAQNAAHRGHRMNGPVLAHESVSFGGTVFVSRANQAAAPERMSRSTLSCRFSRRKRWSSWRSAEVNPSARRPSSRSTCATQLRIVCAVGSNSRANSSGVRPARTRSTICRRNSGGYGARFLPLLGIADSFDTNPGVSTKPGQLHQSGEILS